MFVERMKKRIKRRKGQRKLSSSDFRKYPKSSDNFDIILCEGGHGTINLAKIREAFPDEEKRRAYIEGLIKAFEA